VIRNADSKSVTAISAEMRDLADRARQKKLRPNEYQGGSSAISNLGMYGVASFSAHHQSAARDNPGGRRDAASLLSRRTTAA
jgi:pyruvate/2-oxoglutarate dehydrogenase complex dihydrolipoamide acyltransferase (E2) component